MTSYTWTTTITNSDPEDSVVAFVQRIINYMGTDDAMIYAHHNATSVEVVTTNEEHAIMIRNVAWTLGMKCTRPVFLQYPVIKNSCCLDKRT
jgi:hypothetical protein